MDKPNLAGAGRSGAMMRAPLLAMLALGLTAPADAAKGDVTPLFASEAPLDITISGPVKDIVSKGDHSTEPKAATLAANGETHAIMLSARGLSRREKDACDFPPLMVAITEKPAETSLFAKQGRIKLVTHCRNNQSYEAHVLREYEVYRLYNLLTPRSFKVRLVRVHYVDAGEPLMARWGFFIEDVDDAARRLGGKELSVPTVPLKTANVEDAARYMLFQYMIGNLDFEMLDGPKGTDCCHNSKLIGATAEAREDLIPLPYDFDHSGLVDSPYALPPEVIPVFSVRTRYYRGYCSQQASVRAALPGFVAARKAMEADIRALSQASEKEREKMIDYLGGFFDEAADPGQLEKKFAKQCR